MGAEKVQQAELIALLELSLDAKKISESSVVSKCPWRLKWSIAIMERVLAQKEVQVEENSAELTVSPAS